MKASGTDLPALELLASHRPLVIGHRGCCQFAPENTLPSFKLALAAEADLVELDYRHSRDGVPVVFHDFDFDRTTDARKKWKQRRIKVADKTAAEIQTLDAGSWFGKKFTGTKVPLLTEALEFICGSGGMALIEHKSGDAATCRDLLRERELINKVVVISFDWAYLLQFHQLEPNQTLGALGPPIRLAGGKRPRRVSKKLSARWLEELAKTGARIAVWSRQVSGGAIQSAHQRGLKVWIYTINDASLAKRLVELGVDGIITNDPSAMRNLEARRAR